MDKEKVQRSSAMVLGSYLIFTSYSLLESGVTREEELCFAEASLNPGVSAFSSLGASDVTFTLFALCSVSLSCWLLWFLYLSRCEMARILP